MSNQRTTTAKSKPTKPDERKPLERKRHEDPINRSSSSRPMTEEQKKSEEKFWKNVRSERFIVHMNENQGQAVSKKVHKESSTSLKRKQEINFKRRK